MKGMFRSSVSGYEQGYREPPLHVLLAYARTANVYVDVLIDDELNLPNNLPAERKSKGNKRRSNKVNQYFDGED
jgi:transcriptional regulator with XRE-family HTH domain